jgi:hypothetical protein
MSRHIGAAIPHLNALYIVFFRRIPGKILLTGPEAGEDDIRERICGGWDEQAIYY